MPVPYPVHISKPWNHESSHSGPASNFWSSLSSHSSPSIDEFKGYDYAHPHIQYRKDIDELKEWGIEPYDEPYEDIAPQLGVIHPGSNNNRQGSGPGSKFAHGPYGMPPQYAANAKPIGPSGFVDKSQGPFVVPAQSLGHGGFPSRRPSGQSSNKYPTIVLPSNYKPSSTDFLDKYKSKKRHQFQQQNQKFYDQTSQQQQVIEALAQYQPKTTTESGE